MAAESRGPLGLGAVTPLGFRSPARALVPEPLPAPRTTPVPQQVTLSAEAASLASAPVDPDSRLPDGIARLAVHRGMDEHGKEPFWLKGRSGDQELALDSAYARLRPDDIALSNIRKGGFAPSELLRAVAEWSGNQEDLLGWINDLRARYGTKLQLVVWDDTDYDIPWELLHLPPDHRYGLASGILGALVTVVRWTTIRRPGPVPVAEPASCSGHVLGYYAKDMRGDIEVFEGFIHRVHKASSTFLGDLARPDLGAGLVYMGCHATYGSKLYDLRLDTLTWGELNAQSMAALDGRRTLVCINACHSARMVDNSPRGERALRGFAELFLRKGAGGCIATSGKVGDDVAHTLVRDLVERLCADPELPVAQALREFRARAVAALPDPLPSLYTDEGTFDKVGQQRLLPLLYSFMFLYFGHPLTTLRLSLRAQEARS
ncbi:CHAT domain-containing protein [Streptomyces sp. NPDC047000]|uniref:CHAT domain-containing protein n=1 Tax=Streptomyces sp. NPDC047000 TaxID=3155474 RepID=UPI0033F23D95